MWQPGWEGTLGENGYMYMYGWVPSLFTWNSHNIVNWLFAVVQSLSHVQRFVTVWTAACQASLFFTGSWSLLRLMSIDLVMPSNHLILCRPPFSSCSKSFSASGSFHLFASGGQSIEASASTSVLPVNIQGWFPFGLTGLFSLPSKELSSVFSSTTIQKHLFFSAERSLQSSSHIHTWLLEKPQLWLDGPLLIK